MIAQALHRFMLISSYSSTSNQAHAYIFVQQFLKLMAKPRFLVSLTTSDNDYQMEQAQSADQAGRKFGVDVQIVFADNDAINQSTQVLKAIQSIASQRPTAIVFEPVAHRPAPGPRPQSAPESLGCPQSGRVVIRASQDCCRPDFWSHFRHLDDRTHPGRQIAALLPHGGSIFIYKALPIIPPRKNALRHARNQAATFKSPLLKLSGRKKAPRAGPFLAETCHSQRAQST